MKIEGGEFLPALNLQADRLASGRSEEQAAVGVQAVITARDVGRRFRTEVTVVDSVDENLTAKAGLAQPNSRF